MKPRLLLPISGQIPRLQRKNDRLSEWLYNQLHIKNNNLKMEESKMVREQLRPMFNVIVYDNTENENEILGQTRMPQWMIEALNPDPGSLTWWWQQGGVLQSARKLADAVGEASTWTEALDFVIQSFQQAKAKANNDLTLGVVQFWGHGSKGKTYMDKDYLDVNTLNGSSGAAQRLSTLKQLVTPGTTSIWFRCCSLFSGEKGQEFAVAYRDYFNTDIIGHTYNISALQSGTYILEPGEEPEWPVDEGNTSSGLYEPHTITALRFYPPANW